jgi:hypothetical protein
MCIVGTLIFLLRDLACAERLILIAIYEHGAYFVPEELAWVCILNESNMRASVMSFSSWGLKKAH